MSTIIGTNEDGYVTYVNPPDVSRTLSKNELTANDVLEEVNGVSEEVNDVSEEVNANKITSVIQEYLNVEIPSNLSVNLALPESVPANGFLYATTEDWNRPASGVAPFIVHSRKSGVTIFGTSAVTFPKIVLRFYYVDYDVKGGV